MTEVSIARHHRAANHPLAVRRAVFAALTAATMAALLGLAAATLSVGGLGALDGALLSLFAVTLPWSVVGLWNGVIGLWLMRTAPDPVAAVFPAASRVADDEPVVVSTAILVCVRNEAPERVIGNLRPMLDGLAAAGVAGRFQVYILSDTSKADIAAREEAQFGALAAAWRDRIAISYRRRATNDGFKAGNIRDFCERWGAGHDLAIPLDADSVMPAEAVLRLVRLMQREPQLGIVQALVVGLPSASAMARVFQFGMRLGMRSYTLGSAWWQGDCGPYWGHNAVLRLRPFMEHCALPPLPGGRAVLSHDQIEAVLMRRAGYEVRVLPQEDLGWEENPPTLLEFIRRDLRWCAGNMQYWRVLALPGLPLVSRVQLVLAMLMFLGSPAWIGILVLGSVAAALSPGAVVDAEYSSLLLAIILLMWFAPKIATLADVLARGEARRAFGGAARLMAGAVLETVFSFLLSPIMWLSHTLFLARLPLGGRLGWDAQARQDQAVGLGQAARRLWPHTALGVCAISLLAWRNPAAIPFALVMAGGLALAVPLAVISAAPAAGRLLVRLGMRSYTLGSAWWQGD
ncbi:MAG TPA: glucans biosynthesis glucosyltransferase MdoH, partial [Xanthobacteraceae bacterium]